MPVERNGSPSLLPMDSGQFLPESVGLFFAPIGATQHAVGADCFRKRNAARAGDNEDAEEG